MTHEPTVSPTHACPKCGRACDCYPDSPGECSHDCPPDAAVSPIEAPPKGEFRQFRRSQIAELAEWHPDFDMSRVSISDADREAGSPKLGDMIARNPANHADRWLVAADYFAANFEPLASGQRVVVDPETHATIPKWQIDRVKALIIDRLWPTSPPVNDAVFLELKGMFAGWLSHSSQENRR